MLDIAYVALLDFFVRRQRMSGGSRSRFSRNPAVSPLATSKGVGAEEVAVRRKEPGPEKSTVVGEAS
jgi:hypothetical protein